MPSSRLTRKYQATIPAEIRRALRLKAGDVVEFRVEGRRVSLKRRAARAADRDYLKSLDATLTEWNSPYDEEAYADL
ncbi:MAG: AbrB/MazE/SpoVT family DNA-binding domain-containing protein [Pseudomonadota bacterium]